VLLHQTALPRDAQLQGLPLRGFYHGAKDVTHLGAVLTLNAIRKVDEVLVHTGLNAT
jgi:hypothetical protein